MKLGTTDIQDLKLGATQINEVRKGSTLLWQKQAPAPSYEYLLDVHSGALFAYSFFKLKSTYAGACIRVRRSSDSAEQDFGFSDNYLDTASILSFCGAGNGRVVRIYDQTGNLEPWEAYSASNQLYVVEAGVLKTSNGIAGMNSQSWDQYMYNLNGSSFPAVSSDFNVVSTTNNLFVIGRSIAGVNYYYLLAQQGSSDSGISNKVGSPSHYIDGVSLSPATRGEVYSRISDGAIHVTSSINLAINGTAYDASAYVNSSQPSVEYWFEKVHFSGDKSADRAAIEANIKNRYGI